MRIPLYQVDAFTETVFSGNPAAVCPLQKWLEPTTMQAIAAENNLSETAFFVPTGKNTYDLRWFTPVSEIDLCGHATLASAFILFTTLAQDADSVSFNTQSGVLTVHRDNDLLRMDFPAWPPEACAMDTTLLRAMGLRPVEVMATRDYMLVYESAEDVRSLTPDFSLLALVDKIGVIATAPGYGGQDGPDFVSRFFVPGLGITEDPVTGSAHSTLIPYWAERLGKDELLAHQISARGGVLHCRHRGGRVDIAGKAVLYMEGSILI